MLSQTGTERRLRDNVLLATVLSFVAGTVNGIGYLLVGAYTSHVTGNVARIGGAAAAGDVEDSQRVVALVACFFAGAFSAGAILEAARRLVRAPHALALVVEAGVLVMVGAMETAATPWAAFVPTALLCYAMGLQNALVTSISGAVVRTTHLTGVVTDLGLETVRLLARTGPAMGSLRKLALHVSIFGSFIVGAVAGPVLHRRVGAYSLALPVMTLLALTAADQLSFLRARHQAARAAR